MIDSQLLERLTGIRKRLQTERDAAKRGLDDLDRRLQAITTTIEEITTDAERRRHTVTLGTTDDLLIAELRNKRTQLGGLITIARRNNGKLSTKKALQLLPRAGLMRQTKNGSNIIYNVIKRSGRFKHVGVGEYELTPQGVATRRSIRVEEAVGLSRKIDSVFPSKPVQ